MKTKPILKSFSFVFIIRKEVSPYYECVNFKKNIYSFLSQGKKFQVIKSMRVAQVEIWKSIPFS